MEPSGPLAGYRIGVTAERRKDEIAAVLTRRGAALTIGPALRLIPLVDDDILRMRTQECVTQPCDVMIVTTGIGFRGWMDAADAWGMGNALRRSLTGSRILARGPKATGAIRSAGLREEWTAPSESTDEVVRALLEEGVEGLRVGIQLHGLPIVELKSALEEAGATVVEIPVYRWDFPDDIAPLDRLIRECATGGLDAVVFTSALAVAALLSRATQLDLHAQLIEAFRAQRPLACCVGPVTAAEFVREGVPVILPERARLGDLLRMVSVEVPERMDQVLQLGEYRMTLRRDGYLLDDEFIAVPETPMAIMRELALRPGELVSRARLLELLPEATNDNALETAMARLRTKLPSRQMVKTIVKRGYRLEQP
ncbi:MAG: uroporphyrinogen-III synthase [Candidatus Nanopelagicales bacterium]